MRGKKNDTRKRNHSFRFALVYRHRQTSGVKWKLIWWNERQKKKKGPPFYFSFFVPIQGIHPYPYSISVHDCRVHQSIHGSNPERKWNDVKMRLKTSTRIVKKKKKVVSKGHIYANQPSPSLSERQNIGSVRMSQKNESNIMFESPSHRRVSRLSFENMTPRMWFQSINRPLSGSVTQLRAFGKISHLQ